MISGTPVIAFDRGAIGELIVDGVTGILCRNEDELVEAVDRVDDLSPINCRTHALAHFTALEMYFRHMSILDKVRLGENW
jgi:glycosyltransferase involved in cell wall biosynthesis